METFSLLLFLLFSAVHLYYCWEDDVKGRARTKPFLLFFLLLFYCFAANEIRPLIFGALFFSWLGDILLLLKGTKWFICGGVSFLFSHLLFIAAYCRLTEIRFDLPVLFISLILYGTVTGYVVYRIREYVSHTMRLLLASYLFINGLMNTFALMRLVSDKDLYSMISYIGALFFFISDSILFLVRFHPEYKTRKGRSFAVMITYLLGELLITVGLLNV